MTLEGVIGGEKARVCPIPEGDPKEKEALSLAPQSVKKEYPVPEGVPKEALSLVPQSVKKDYPVPQALSLAP
jgi:hypothetical protein